MFKTKGFLGSYGSPTFQGSYKASRGIMLKSDTSNDVCCPDSGTAECCDGKEGHGKKLSLYS